MPSIDLDSNTIDSVIEHAWTGNNAAFTCPIDGKVYIVSAILHPRGRSCPACGKSTGQVKGGRNNGGTARLEW